MTGPRRFFETATRDIVVTSQAELPDDVDFESLPLALHHLH